MKNQPFLNGIRIKDTGSLKGILIPLLNIQFVFFNNENVLLYRENLSGVKLNPARRAVKMKLKKVLENAAHAWETKKVVEENKSYVAAILR